MNRADPTPLYPYPNAYDINLAIDRLPKPYPFISIGPIRATQPVLQRPYDNYAIWWTAQVVAYIDSADTVSRYQAVAKGKRTIKIDWRKGSQVLATTTYNLVI